MGNNSSGACLASIVLIVGSFLEDREYLPHGNEASSEAVETIDPTVVQLSVAASRPEEMEMFKGQIRKRDEAGENNGRFSLA